MAVAAKTYLTSTTGERHTQQQDLPVRIAIPQDGCLRLRASSAVPTFCDRRMRRLSS